MKNVLLTLYSRKIGNRDQIWTGKWGAQSGNFSSGCGTSREMMWWCNCASWMTQWPVRRCITGFGGKGARGLLQTAAPVFGNDAMTVKRLNVEKMTSSRLLPNLRGLWIDVRNEWIKMSHRSKIKMIHLKIFHSTNKSPGWGLPILQDPDEIHRATSGQIDPNFIPHVGFGLGWLYFFQFRVLLISSGSDSGISSFSKDRPEYCVMWKNYI